MRNFPFLIAWAALVACHPLGQPEPDADQGDAWPNTESSETCSTVVLAPDDLLLQGELGEEALAAFDIINPCPDLPLMLAGVTLTDDFNAFEILTPDLDQLVLEPGEIADLLVAFTAQADEIHLADLELWLEGQDEPASRNVLLGIVPTGSRSGAAPTADAGSSQTITLGDTASLDASGSSDPEGDSLTYLWTFKSIASGSGLSNSSITDATSVSASFTPDVAGSYRVRLVVSDGTSVAKRIVSVTATSGSNSAPVADAGANQAVTLGSVATADGTGSSDADGDPITTTWTLHASPAASSLTTSDLSDASTTTPSFTPDVTGIFRLKLRVSDGAAQSKDFVSIVVSTLNTAPDSNAGADQDVETGAVVTLDGSASSDDDGDSLTYTWTLHVVPAGSSLTSSDITNASTETASFTPDVDGTYRVKLLLNDGRDKGKDFATVTASADADGDGYTVSAGDCDDDDVNVNPGATEICDDSIDNNCSGTIDLTPAEEDGVKTYTFFMWFDEYCYNTPGASGLFDWCTYSEEVSLNSSPGGGFTVTPDCELEGVPDPGTLTVDCEVDSDGQISFLLTATEAPISHTSEGEMCNGTAYQWGDPDLWNGTAEYPYNPPHAKHWTYTCYNTWYFTLNPA